MYVRYVGDVWGWVRDITTSVRKYRAWAEVSSFLPPKGGGGSLRSQVCA